MKTSKFLSILLLFLNPNTLRFAITTQVNSSLPIGFQEISPIWDKPVFDKYNDTDLEEAISQNDSYKVREILSSIKRQTSKPIQIKKHFENVLKKNSSELISDFIEHDNKLANQRFDNGQYPIHFVTYNQDNLLLKRLLQLKVNINSQYRHSGHTALFLAVGFQLQAQIDFLLAQGADTHIHDNSDTGILAYAVTYADEHVVKQLLQLKGKQQIPKADIIQGYLRAGSIADRAFIKAFLNHDPTLLNAWVDKTHNDEMQIIHIAAQQGSADVVQILFDEGANINAPTMVQSITPIYIAAYYKNYATLKKLLELGADPNPGDTKEALGSPLHATCLNDDKAAAKLLLQHGANIHKQYRNWLSPLEYCKFLKNEDMAEFLIRNVPPPPTQFEKLTKIVKRMYQSNYLWMATILSAVLYKFYKHQQAKQLLEKQRQEESTEKVKLLVNRDKEVLQSLNAMIKPIYPKAVWQFGSYTGKYILQMPRTGLKLQDVSSLHKDQQYSCAIHFDVVHATIFKQLILPMGYTKGQQNNHTLLVELSDKLKLNVELCQPEANVAAIKSALYQGCIASDEYKSQEFQLIKKQLLSEFKSLENEINSARLQYARAIEFSKNNTVLLKDKCTTLSLQEAASNKRLVKIQETITRILNQYSEENLQDFKNLIEKVAVDYQHEFALLGQATFPMKIDFSELRSKKDRLLATLRSQTIDNKRVEASMRDHMNEFDNAIQAQLQDRNKEQVVTPVIQLTLQEKRRQREQAKLDEQAEQERQRQEALNKKEQHRLKQAEERQLLEERRREAAERAERIKLAAQKRQEERAQSSSSSSSSSNSSNDLHPKLQTKLMNIGDLLQRRHSLQNLSEAIEVQYKYALLAECLRLFELTHQLFVRSRVASDVRNALMHQHRFLDIHAICQLAEFIAHKPGDGLAGRIRKFENVIDDLETGVTTELKGQLDDALLALSLSEFFTTYVRLEREKPTIKTYLETMLYLVQDLEKLNTKVDVDLALDADKVFAINGILMCFGECYQQIKLLESADLFVIDGKYSELIDAFLKLSIRVRTTMGHRTHELQENLGHYYRYLTKASVLVEYVQEVVDLLRDENKIDDAPAFKM